MVSRLEDELTPGGIYDFTDVCEWPVEIEETLGQPGTARFTLKDRDVPPGLGDFASRPGGPLHPRQDGRPDSDRRSRRLPVPGHAPGRRHRAEQKFPWRRHHCSATDYQREMFDRRMVGVPSGDLWWASPDTDGNYLPVDPRAWLRNEACSSTRRDRRHHRGPVSRLCADRRVRRRRGTTFVTILHPADRQHRRGRRSHQGPGLSRAAGCQSRRQPPVLGGSGPRLDRHPWMHWKIVPRWFEQETPDYFVALGLRGTVAPLETAPFDIDNDTPDGVTSIGSRGLRYRFDYSNDVQQFWVNGGPGRLRLRRASGGRQEGRPAGSHSGRATSCRAASPGNPRRARSRRRGDEGRGRGPRRQGGQPRDPARPADRRQRASSPRRLARRSDVQPRDARLPGYLNDRRYVIQKVTTTLEPGENWRIYDRLGRRPLARASSRRAPVEPKPLLPVELGAGLPGPDPTPSSIWTVVNPAGRTTRTSRADPERPRSSSKS